MRDMKFYVDRAIERSGAKSQRQFCAMLDLSNNAIVTYKKGVLPTDETMLRIAAAAGIDPVIALLDLNLMRSQGQGEAQNVYMAMMKKMTAVAIAGVLIAVGVSPAPEHAKVNDNCDTNPQLVYIMENMV